MIVKVGSNRTSKLDSTVLGQTDTWQRTGQQPHQTLSSDNVIGSDKAVSNRLLKTHASLSGITQRANRRRGKVPAFFWTSEMVAQKSGA